MRIDVVPMDVAALPDWLGRGVVDLAVTPSHVPGPFGRTVLKSQGYGVAMSAAHPLADEPPTLDAYAAASHVVVASDSGAPALAEARRAHGIEIDARIAVNHLASLPPLLARDRDLIATLPDTIALGWTQTWPLVVRPLPFEMPPVEIALYRRSSSQHPAALDWLFETVARAIRGSSGRFEAIHGEVGGTHS